MLWLDKAHIIKKGLGFRVSLKPQIARILRSSIQVDLDNTDSPECLYRPSGHAASRSKHRLGFGVLEFTVSFFGQGTIQKASEVSPSNLKHLNHKP